MAMQSVGYLKYYADGGEGHFRVNPNFFWGEYRLMHMDVFQDLATTMEEIYGSVCILNRLENDDWAKFCQDNPDLPRNAARFERDWQLEHKEELSKLLEAWNNYYFVAADTYAVFNRTPPNREKSAIDAPNTMEDAVGLVCRIARYHIEKEQFTDEGDATWAVLMKACDDVFLQYGPKKVVNEELD
jgi:hypothetical protein